MIVYIIKSIICSGILLTIYVLLLEREKTYQFNRLYLLLVIPLSLIIPVITLQFDNPTIYDIPSIYEEIGAIQQTAIIDIPANQPEVQKTSAFTWVTIILGCYGLITLILLIRFLTGLIKITNVIRAHTRKKIENALLIEVDQPTTPHTFLRYIFISKADVENKQIITHELTHLCQKHSLDILFIELLQCFLWINPFLIWLKKLIKLNHEFIADEAVVNTYSETAEYQRLLLMKAGSDFQSPLASSFSYSLTKKRFVMMTRQRNLKSSAIKIALSMLFVCLVALLFSERAYSQTNDEIKSTTPGDTIKTVSPEMMLEFEILINQYGIKSKMYPDHVAINRTGLPESERLRMKEIYDAMTAEQKTKFPPSIIYVMLPVPSPKKQSPTQEQLTSWKDAKIYGVWLDGKRVNNKDLDKVKPGDLGFYGVSKLLKNAVHYGQYKYQVDLMTVAYFDKTYPPKSN